MTQPDLVSKLREVIAKVKPLVEKATPMPWSTNSQFIPQASAKILVGSDRRSIAYVGMNPQSKEWETYAQDITNTLLIIAAVNAMDELESLLGLEGQAAADSESLFEHICDFCGKWYRGQDHECAGQPTIPAPSVDSTSVNYKPPCGPSQPETIREGYKGICVCGHRSGAHHESDPSCEFCACKSYRDVSAWGGSHSTPIVPGTAGLSAEQVLEIANRHRVTVAGYEFADKFDFEGIAADLNALLGAANPAERWTCPDCGYDSMPYPPKDYHICPKCMVEFGNDDRKSTLLQREARIRKDVLREVAQHVPKLIFSDSPISQNAGGSYTVATIGCSCGWKGGWSVHILLLAERPAPAGEVKGEKS